MRQDTIVLRDNQRVNCDEVCEILDDHPSAINTADMGSGKTPVTIETARARGMAVFTLCKKSTVSDWNKYKDLFKKFHVMTYESFRPKNKNFSHNWLMYKDGEIVPTQKLVQLIRAGCLFVFDESQAAKNAQAQQTKACCAISNAVRNNFEARGKSRIVLLSRTPTSGKPIQIVSMLRLAGVIKSEKLIEKKAGGYVETGFAELIEFCSKINPVETERLTKYLVINNKSVIERTYDLYETVLKKTIVVTMENKAKNIDIYNVFFELSKSSLEALRDTKRTYQCVKKELDAGVKKGKLIQKYNVLQRQQTIELYKEDIFVDVTCDLLEYDPDIRVIIYLWSRKVLERVAQALKDYHPVILNGSVQSIKERTKRLKEFTNPDSKARILLTHPSVLAAGTNIVDPTETITFFSLMNAGVFYDSQHQASGRTTRGSYKKSYFVVVYIDGLEEEKEILHALSDRSDNLRKIIKSQQELTFLTDHPIVYERNLSSITELL